MLNVHRFNYSGIENFLNLLTMYDFSSQLRKSIKTTNQKEIRRRVKVIEVIAG